MTVKLALTPPMGWNSFDCYDLAVTEEEVIGNAEYMARHLRKFGYEYIVIDASWYDPSSAAWGRSDVPFEMDAWGRLLPCPAKFPSSADGAGFKPLADKIHALGLKFGIHIMRGISRWAVRKNTPVCGTELCATDIALTSSVCSWWEQSYGLKPTANGSQEWYDSNFKLYAQWGVDLIKADDCSFPYYAGEIELIRNAIDRCGRPMVLSLSPGESPVDKAEHLKRNANMWRISGDFWDEWPQLLKMFTLLDRWHTHIGPGHWPDADMLPLGAISLRRNPARAPRFTRFTPAEQRTLMTLWCIARSPLMYGGDLRVLDPFTLALIANTDVLRMHRESSGNRPLYRREYREAWAALGTSGEIYLALFNSSDHDEVQMSATLEELGITGPVQGRELWEQTDTGLIMDRLQTVVPPHGCKLFRLATIEKENGSPQP